MKRAWLALAMLSGSWLFGLEYFQPERAGWWVVLIGAAVLLMGHVALPKLGRIEACLAMALSLPAIFVARGIYCAIPILFALGCATAALRWPIRWLERIGRGALGAGIVLLVQAVALHGYEAATARQHDLPGWLARPVAGIAKLVGADAAFNEGSLGPNVELFTMRRVHPIGATWELLAGPATACFAAGGMMLLLLASKRPRWKSIAVFLGIVVAWLPVRVALLLGFYLHRALLTDYDAPLDAMSQFFNPWAHFLLLLGPALVGMLLLKDEVRAGKDEGGRMKEEGNARLRPGAGAEEEGAAISWSWRGMRAPGSVLLGTLLVVFGLFACLSGEEKKGRVLFHELHSKWEPTDRPYDTEWYGQDSGYNYYCIYDYLTRFYDTQRLQTPITRATLRPDDVLIVKVPTSAYAPEEIREIERFVRDGGSVLFIGEHTDVFGTGTYINQVTRPFGFAFRFDCAFGIRSVFEQLYEPPLLAHPIVQRMGPLDFAISATIDVGWGSGRAAIRGTGLKNAFADYHASNFYPQIDDFPDSRYGSFVQMWAREFERGRVVAFADSTQYSNFSAFEPGKPEMLRGMIQWLRRKNSNVPTGLVALAGAALLVYGVGRTLAQRRGWALAIGAGLAAWACAVPLVRAANRASLPEPKPVRPMTKVAIDRTVCDSVLSKAGFIGGKENGFGVFERWILRLGCFTFRASGDDVFDSKMIVFFHPRGDVTPAFRDRLVRYVKEGGHVLILDGPENEKSTANSLLWPFKLSVKKAEAPLSGTVSIARKLALAPIPVGSALRVEGGQPVARLMPAGRGEPVTVAAGDRYVTTRPKADGTEERIVGTVTVIGFASRFSDSNMGVTGDMEPTPAMRAVYEWEFELLRRILNLPIPMAP